MINAVDYFPGCKVAKDVKKATDLHLAVRLRMPGGMPSLHYTCSQCVPNKLNTKELNSVALVRKQTIPTERPPLVGEVSANFCG
jgi:hypothetical protein